MVKRTFHAAAISANESGSLRVTIKRKVVDELKLKPGQEIKVTVEI